MLNDAFLKDFNHIYLATGFTDLRLGIDGLANLIEEKFHLNAYDRSLFLFCGRKADRIKGLVWEGDGYLLLYKRLETGRFRWPRNPDEIRDLSQLEFTQIINGLKPDQKGGNPRVYPADFQV